MKQIVKNISVAIADTNPSETKVSMVRRNPLHNHRSAMSPPAEMSFRRATSTMEVIVAIALLAAATTVVGGFVHRVQKGLRDRELSARFDWELKNTRERIGSWPEEHLTLERIQQIELSKSLLPGDSPETKPRLTASIQKIEKPLPATQITLAIECNLHGQTIQPSIFTFWVPTSVEAKP